ncbi:MAG: hypothetical protein ACXU86_00900 [Archangium sp.]
MGLATSEDTIRGMLFNGTLEVLQSLVKRCVEASGEARFLDFFSYRGAQEVTVSGRQTGGLDSECDFCWQ